MILALETSGAVGSVAFCRGEAVLGIRCFDTRQEAVRRLPPAVQELTADQGGVPPQAIAVSCGPGSFNGLRVGIALAKAMAHALRLPVVGVSTPQAWAAESVARCAGQAVAVLQPSRRDYVYLTLFAPEVADPGPLGPAEVGVDRLVEGLAIPGTGQSACATVLTGDWAELSAWAAAHPKVAVADAHRAVSPSAATVARLAGQRLGQVAEDSYYSLRPAYVSPSQAERNWGVNLGL